LSRLRVQCPFTSVVDLNLIGEKPTMLTKRSHRSVVTAVMLGLLLSFIPNASFSQDTVNPRGAVIAPPPPEPSSDLKVMTWNILGGLHCKLNRRMEKVAEAVMNHDGLDVLALQEVYRDQAAKLAEHLRERGFGFFFVHFVRTKSCGGRGKDFGIALLSRHVILSYREYPLPQAPDHSPTTGKPCDRGERRMLAGISIFARGRFVDVYTTHLTSCGGDEVREDQAKVIMRRIREDERAFERTHKPFAFRPILMGDMNSRPTSDAHGVITERFRDAGASDPHATYHTLNPRIRIDYIFFDKGVFKLDNVRVTSNQTLFSIFEVAHPERLDEKEDADDLPMPDHLPVTARLSYN
jgi:endonuclease/exonuclease/phosphatase family metal-dependent hydrolase